MITLRFMRIAARLWALTALTVLAGLLAFVGTSTIASREVFAYLPAAADFPICAIQSRAFDSPYSGAWVRTQGVVFADLDMTSRQGFFIQAADCDADPLTSDGIFVYLGVKSDTVRSGDLVEVQGTIQEYYGMTELSALPADVRLLSQGNALPVAADLVPPFDPAASRRYFEALEGMHVKLDQAQVVGPTDPNSQTWLVRADLGLRRVFRDDPAGTGEIVCVDDGGLYEVDPQARVGDRLHNLRGALDYAAGVYCLKPVIPPLLLQQSGPGLWLDHSHEIALASGSQAFTAATFNLAGLFDTYDDPASRDVVLSAAEYQRRLQKRALAIHNALKEPDLIAVQEAENRTVLQHLVDRPEIEADYGIVWADGPDERGMDVALLYRTARVTLLDYQVRQGCTTLIDGLGPDGNQDVYRPSNAFTCDTNGDGSLDGNRLFSRPPLIVHLQICTASCSAESGQPVELWALVNHWKARLEDSLAVQYTLPRRSQEAEFVAALAREVWASQSIPNLLVLGDLNDYPDSAPLAALSAVGLSSAWPRVDHDGRYSYIYQGVSQVLDHVLFSLTPPLAAVGVTPVHINADYPAVFAGVSASFYRSSDHDPVLVEFKLLDHLSFLPLINYGH